MNRYRIATGTEKRINPIQEVLKLTEVEELRIELELRVELEQQMIGSLYPSILRDEQNKIAERMKELS